MSISSKIPLTFRADGHFRILMVSDIQETTDYDPRTPDSLRALIRKADPDLVIWGGDNADGRYLKTEPELREYLAVMAAPMEEAGIPWMHVYGNHDYDIEVSPERQSQVYAECAHNISGTSPDGVPGMTNYAIPVLDPASGKPAYVVYAFDTMHKEAELRPGVTTAELLSLPEKWRVMRKWEPLRFEQLMWYWNTSNELEAECGRTVPALAVMHVPPYEFHLVVENPAETGLRGETDEKLQCGVLNSGVFAAMLERGDVNVIAAGHLHADTFDATFAGIRCCLDGCGGWKPKSKDDRRGGRLFDVTLDGKVETEMIRYIDL